MKNVVKMNFKKFKHIRMAIGYQHMSTLNLRISQDDYHLEEEGARFYEMDSEEGSSIT